MNDKGRMKAEKVLDLYAQPRRSPKETFLHRYTKMNSNLYDEANALLNTYRDTASLNETQKKIINEAISRLRAACEQLSGLIGSNASLLSEDPILTRLRESFDDEKINQIMQERATKDPELAKYLESIGGKLIRVQSTEVSTYDMTSKETDGLPQAAQLKLLHEQTEAFYHGLWSVKQRLNQLPKFKRFNPGGVRDVRNQLIVHTDDPKVSGAYLFSFGVTTNGPVLRPVKPTGIKAKNDAGVEKNFAEFLSSIIKVLS